MDYLNFDYKDDKKIKEELEKIDTLFDFFLDSKILNSSLKKHINTTKRSSNYLGNEMSKFFSDKINNFGILNQSKAILQLFSVRADFKNEDIHFNDFFKSTNFDKRKKIANDYIKKNEEYIELMHQCAFFCLIVRSNVLNSKPQLNEDERKYAEKLYGYVVNLYNIEVSLEGINEELSRSVNLLSSKKHINLHSVKDDLFQAEKRLEKIEKNKYLVPEKEINFYKSIFYDSLIKLSIDSKEMQDIIGILENRINKTDKKEVDQTKRLNELFDDLDVLYGSSLTDNIYSFENFTNAYGSSSDTSLEGYIEIEKYYQNRIESFFINDNSPDESKLALVNALYFSTLDTTEKIKDVLLDNRSEIHITLNYEGNYEISFSKEKVKNSEFDITDSLDKVTNDTRKSISEITYIYNPVTTKLVGYKYGLSKTFKEITFDSQINSSIQSTFKALFNNLEIQTGIEFKTFFNKNIPIPTANIKETPIKLKHIFKKEVNDLTIEESIETDIGGISTKGLVIKANALKLKSTTSISNENKKFTFLTLENKFKNLSKMISSSIALSFLTFENDFTAHSNSPGSKTLKVLGLNFKLQDSGSFEIADVKEAINDTNFSKIRNYINALYFSATNQSDKLKELIDKDSIDKDFASYGKTKQFLMSVKEIVSSTKDLNGKNKDIKTLTENFKKESKDNKLIEKVIDILGESENKEIFDSKNEIVRDPDVIVTSFLEAKFIPKENRKTFYDALSKVDNPEKYYSDIFNVSKNEPFFYNAFKEVLINKIQNCIRNNDAKNVISILCNDNYNDIAQSAFIGFKDKNYKETLKNFFAELSKTANVSKPPIDSLMKLTSIDNKDLEDCR